MTNNHDLDRLLRFDALDTAEKLTGKDSANDRETMGVGFALLQMNAKAKEQALTERGDTTFMNEVPRYKAVIEGYGFEPALTLPFQGHDGEETFNVYTHRDGLLLQFDTYGAKSVNGAKVSYNWRPFAEKIDWTLISSGHLHMTEYVWCGHHDGREALLFKMDRLRKHGEFVAPWIEQPFLWLLHYMDTKQKDYNRDAINAERTALLPQWVQDMITPKSR